MAQNQISHRTVSFYDRETGLFNGSHLIASDEAAVKLNTPPDHLVMDGHHDPLSKRVDITTGQVVEYVPPKPSDDHIWDGTTKRWRLDPAIEERRFARQSALAQIAALEVSQHRPLRELALDSSNAKARKRLEAIEAEIAELREALR